MFRESGSEEVKSESSNREEEDKSQNTDELENDDIASDSEDSYDGLGIWALTGNRILIPIRNVKTGEIYDRDSYFKYK